MVSSRFQRFISFRGEIGRDDLLRGTLVLFISLVPVVFVLAGWMQMNDLDVDLLENKWVKLIIYFGTLRFTLPLSFKRWRDLGPRLSKFWFGLYLLNILIPSYKDFDDPGLKAFLSALALVTLYPAFKLIFCPGNKYYRIKAENQEIVAAKIVVDDPSSFELISGQNQEP